MTHVLIIDDNAANASVLGVLLEQESVDYTSLLTPRNLATEIEGMGQVDVVFLDLEMPNYDGFDVYNDLRDLLPGVPIVAYSVHTSEMSAAREVGFDGFLGKPISTADFPENLRRILNREPVWTVGGE
jgi:CheY-like chemotaxis protein